MSRIRFLCPECSSKLSVESDSAHQFTECPKCHESIRAWGAKLLDIKFACSTCGKKMMIDANAAGCMIDCPSCKKSTKVPGEPPATSPKDATALPQPAKKVQPVSPGNAAPLLTSEEVTFLVGDVEK